MKCVWKIGKIKNASALYVWVKLLTKCEAGYWPSTFFACLWTKTELSSINSQKKKNEANSKPS